MAITDKRLYIWLDAVTYGKLVELAHKSELSLNSAVVRCIDTASFPKNNSFVRADEPGRCKHCKATILPSYDSCSDCTARLEFEQVKKRKGGSVPPKAE